MQRYVSIPERNLTVDHVKLTSIRIKWAGTALSVPEYRESLQLDAVNKYADGICTNFHKWGLVAFDCSALWVRDRRVLTNALDVTPAFLRTKHGDTGVVVDYRNWSLSASLPWYAGVHG
jgi:glutamate/tyrosine decarboxylase-like PLP-dependent enzyme